MSKITQAGMSKSKLKMSEFDNLNFCFICSKKTEEDEESFQKNQNMVVGTLCQLLNLPLRDNTLNFGVKFQQTRFCSDCKIKVRGFNKILKELKGMENQVLEGRNQIESALKRSCQKQGEFLKSKAMSCRNGMSLTRTTMIQNFREEIVTELRKNGQWSASNSTSRSRANSGPCEKCSYVIQDQDKVHKAKISLLDLGKLPVPKLEIDTSSQGMLSPSRDKLAFSPITPPKVVPEEKVDVSKIPFNLSEIGEDAGEESDEFEEDEDIDGTEDIKFITNTKVEIRGAIPKITDLKKKVIVRGQFPCVFAPNCNALFKKHERLKFLAHLRYFHDTEVQKVIQPADIVITVQMEDEETETKTKEEVPAAVPNSVPVPESVPVPNSVAIPDFVPVQNPVAIPDSVPVPIPNSVPIPESVPVPVQNSIAIPNFVPIPDSVPRSTVPVPNSLPVKKSLRIANSALIPNSFPVPIPNHVPKIPDSSPFIVQYPGPPHRHDNQVVTNFSCVKCGTYFCKKYSLTRHQQRYHSIDIRMSPSKKSPPAKSRKRKRSGIVASTPIKRKLQYSNVEPQIATTSGLTRVKVKVEDTKPEKSALDTSIGNIYKCDFCGDSYFFQADLTRHVMLTHDSSSIGQNGVGVYNKPNILKPKSNGTKSNGHYKIIWQRH